MRALLTEKALGGKYRHAFYYAAASTFEREAPQHKELVAIPTAIVASTVVETLSTGGLLLAGGVVFATALITYAMVNALYIDMLAYTLYCNNTSLNTLGDSIAESNITSGVSFFGLEENAATAATTAGIDYGMMLSDDFNEQIQRFF